MLVTTVEQVREVIPVNALNEFATFKPYVDKAERWIRPLLGTALYDRLKVLAVPDEALTLARICVVNYAMYDGFDMLNSTYDDSGFRRASKDQSLYRYQEDNIRSSFQNAAYNGVDDLLEYLQANIATYAEFESSEFYTASKSSIFPTTASFNKVYNINNSRLVFLQIAGFFDRVIDFEIKPLMTDALFISFVDNLSKEGVERSADLDNLIPYVRKVMAFYAVGYGIDELGMRITEKGFFFEKQLASSNSHITTEKADADRLRSKALTNAERYKAMLFEFLQTHPDQYDLTVVDASTNPYRRDNTDKKTAWF